MQAEHDIGKLAERQHGNVTITQLHDAGLSRDQIRRMTARGLLRRRHMGVYAVGHTPGTRESRWLAAVLALGPEAVLSHRAAGALWGIVRGPVVTEVLVSTRAGRTKRDGILVHRAALAPDEVTVRNGIPVTSLIRTVLDLATVISDWGLDHAFEEAQVRHHLSPAALAVAVLARRRYRGSGRLGRLLANAVDPEKVRSVLELRFLKLCDRYGLPRPLVNEKVEEWRPDFLWRDAHLVVETDGLRFHRTAATRRRDAKKDAYFRARGYAVIRLNWADVVEDSGATATVVADALTTGGG